MLEIIKGFISCTIFLIAVYSFGLMILKEPGKKKNSIMYNCISIFASILLYTIIFQTMTGTIKTIMHCILVILIYTIIFHSNIGKSFISSIIYAVLSMLSDIIVLVTFTKIFNIEKEIFYIEYAGGIIGNISVTILAIILIFLLKKPIRKLVNYKFNTNIKIVMVSFAVLISLAIFFYSLISTFKFSDNITGYLIVIITLIIILFYLFKQKIENEAISKKYDELLNIMKTYENDIEEQRTMIHETRNELMTIKSKINDKEKETAIIKYIDSIIGDKVNSKMSKYSKFTYLPSNGIKGFFYYKFMEAEKRQINVSVNISKRIENSFLGKLDTNDFKDLVRIIGVYLDNAIEASSESEDKKLGIEIYVVKENIEIIISNTYRNDIDIEKIGIDKFTTKGKNHGHGLLLVKRILQNNNIFESENKIINDLFVQKIMIKENK